MTPSPDAVDGLLALARGGRLYPALILHGASDERRRAAAAALARTLLCEREPAARPCGECRHCRRKHGFWGRRDWKMLRPMSTPAAPCCTAL
jgi:DNA polymerase III delta prime subunit